MDITIRKATTNDAKDILDIYSYYVTETAVSFEHTVPSLEAFKARIRNTLEGYPYLVAVSEGHIVGYAYAGPFIPRAAYSRCAELTVYIDKDYRRNGIGRMLYTELEDILRKMGILNLYACIAIPSEKEDEYLTSGSIDFHEQVGFVRVGMFRDCGYKFDRWYDMVWAEKLIGEHTAAPKPVLKYTEI